MQTKTRVLLDYNYYIDGDYFCIDVKREEEKEVQERLFEVGVRGFERQEYQTAAKEKMVSIKIPSRHLTIIPAELPGTESTEIGIHIAVKIPKRIEEYLKGKGVDRVSMGEMVAVYIQDMLSDIDVTLLLEE